MLFVLLAILGAVLTFAQLPVTGTAPSPGYSSSCCSDAPIVDWKFSTLGRRATPQFSNEHGIRMNYYAMFGQNDQSGVSKRTFVPFNLGATYQASGQRLVYNGNAIYSGHGDGIIQSFFMNVLGNAASSGDEGFMLYRADTHHGNSAPFTTTIGTPVATTCNTTTTQAITRSQDSNTGQVATTVTVSSSTGCVANDWVTIESSHWGSSDNEEVVQLTTVTTGVLTAVFLKDHNSGVTVKPALMVPAGATTFSTSFGQDRLLVNLTQAVTGAGTADIGGGSGDATRFTVTGHGTAFANSLIGGTAQNPGCISLNSDITSGVKTWMMIDVISSTTSLTIYLGGDRRVAVTGSTYQLAPCAVIRNFVFNSANPPASTSLVLSNNPFIWANGDSVECAVDAAPLIQGFQDLIYPVLPHGNWGPRWFTDNQGSRDLYGPAFRIKGTTTGGYQQGFVFENVTNPIWVSSDGVHIGNTIEIFPAAGDPKGIKWSGLLTGGAAHWILRPDDATANYELFDEGQNAAAWTAYRQGQGGTNDLSFSVSRGFKAAKYTASDDQVGASATVVVKGSAGTNCNLVFKDGLYVSTTCP